MTNATLSILVLAIVAIGGSAGAQQKIVVTNQVPLVLPGGARVVHDVVPQIGYGDVRQTCASKKMRLMSIYEWLTAASDHMRINKLTDAGSVEETEKRLQAQLSGSAANIKVAINPLFFQMINRLPEVVRDAKDNFWICKSPAGAGTINPDFEVTVESLCEQAPKNVIPQQFSYRCSMTYEPNMDFDFKSINNVEVKKIIQASLEKFEAAGGFCELFHESSAGSTGTQDLDNQLKGVTTP